MAIIFGGDAGIQQDTLSAFTNAIAGEFNRVKSGLLDNFSRLTGAPSGLNPQPEKEKVFIEDGFSNVPGTSFVGSQIEGIDDIKTRRITTQEPQMTVYVKKRAFWSLRNENDTKFMDPGEKLYLRASKILFETKCSQIAAYESLTKAGRLISEDADFDAERMEIVANALEESASNTILNITNSLNAIQASGAVLTVDGQNIMDELVKQLNDLNNDQVLLRKAVESIRKLTRDQRKLKQATTTNWVVDPTNGIDVINVGRGSGVIELTSITNLNTDLSLETGHIGSIQISIEDPYNLMKITNDNIEIALASAFQEQEDISIASSAGISSEEILKTSGFNIGPQQLLEAARQKDDTLKRIRRNRINNAFGLAGAGSALSGSDAADIVFEVNPSSFAKNKITGSVPIIPEQFTKDNFRIILLQLPIEHQLTLEEDTLVVEIFDLLDRYVTEVQRLNSATLENNSRSEVKYARRQLRAHYLGKHIIQPMDGLHIYIRGNTFKDGEIVGPLSAVLNGTSFIRSFADDHNASIAVLEEEMKQFGLDKLSIPVEVYRKLRTGSFMRNAGMHVFGGLASSVSESYTAERGYVLNVSGESNLKWLNLSRVNTAPSLDQPKGLLEDPLTPYDLESAIDTGTGLIRERPSLLDANKTLIREGKIRYVTGPKKGQLVLNEQDLEQDFIPFGDSMLAVGTHAPGLVYRWKQGVIAASQRINNKTPLDGRGIESNLLAQRVGINITNTPFDNLDAADIVSLLVTGFPHSYENFLLNTAGLGLYNYGDQANSSESYFHSFFDITRRTNKALGNFQPFKPIQITPAQVGKRLSLQADLKNASKRLNELRAEYARLQDQLNSINSSPEQIQQLSDVDESRRKIAVAGLSLSMSAIKIQMDAITSSFMSSIQDAEAEGLRVYGNDKSLEFENTTANSDTEQIREGSKKLRLKNEILQFRNQLNCKFNSDSNYFIVSDDYDKDLDLQAFIVEAVSSKELAIWDNTQYKHPYDICKDVAKVLDFEFYCDTQGHIQFRPPKYNRIPLSLILKLFLLNRNQNKKLYPEFLEQLFQNRQNSFRDEAEIIDIEIKIKNILLGRDPETNDIANITITDENRGTANGVVVSTPLAANNELTEDQLREKVETVIHLNNLLYAKRGGKPQSFSNPEVAKKIKNEIAELNNSNTPNVNSRRLDIFNKIAELESAKQRVLSTMSKIQQQTEKFQTTVKSANLVDGSQSTPEMIDLLTPFADLIEDDFNDLLGPGSSKRFIITDDQIISSTFTESDANVICRYDVTGQENHIGEGAGVIGGVPVIWAGATDFDLWRQYGWRSEGSINKPYFKDAELQCAPYALMLLARAKKDVVRGNITIYGNEFYQLGDVVYINSRDMLYYVTGIKHNFSYEGGTFTTTLDLRYGHPLGEYIATPFDVIGKNLIKTQRHFNTKTVSRETANKKLGVNIGVVVFSSFAQEGVTPNANDAFIEMLGGEIGASNLEKLKNAFSKAKNHLVEGQPFPKIEIRGFIEDEADKDLVLARIEAVKSWFIVPSSNTDTPLSYNDFPGFSPASIQLTNDEIDPIHVTNPQEDNMLKGRFPKEEVFNVVNGKNSFPFSNVIEIVLVFE